MTLSENLYSLRKTLLTDSIYYRGTDFKSFPYDYFIKDLGIDCGVDTDLYQCTMDGYGITIRFSVEVKKAYDINIITNIDTHSCDILANDKIYDCIDIADDIAFSDIVTKIVKEKYKIGMKNYEVSVPLFLCPYVKVEAEDEKEAKEVAGKLIMSIINSEFPKNDCRTIDGGGMDSKEWKIERLDSENDKAFNLLVKHNVSLEHFKNAEVTETKDVNGAKIEFIFLDFDEGLVETCGNLSYIRINNVPYFLADIEKGYPSSIHEAKSYVWTDGDDNFFFFNENFDKIQLNPLGGWDNDITYLRAVEINKLLDYEGIIIKEASDYSMSVKTVYDDENTIYVFQYKYKDDIKAFAGKKVQELVLS